MRQKINRSQLERLITECVQDTLAEQSYTRRSNRQVMNEAQLQNFVRNVINEELENEDFFNNVKNGVQGWWNGGHKYDGDAKRGRIQSFKNAYDTSKLIDSMDDVSKVAQRLIRNGLNPKTTLAQIAAGQGKGSANYGMMRGQMNGVLNANKQGYSGIRQPKK